MAKFPLDVEITPNMEKALRLMTELGEKGNFVSKSLGTVKDIFKGAFDILAKFGIVSVSAFTALSMASPALARNMAEIQKSLFDLSSTAGESLKPVFDVISGAFKEVSNWASGEGKPTLDALGKSMATVASEVWEATKAVGGFLLKVGKGIAATITLTFGSEIAGDLFTSMGVGAAAGLLALLIKPLRPYVIPITLLVTGISLAAKGMERVKESVKEGVLDEPALFEAAAGAGLAGAGAGALAGSFIPGLGTLAGGIIGGAIGFLGTLSGAAVAQLGSAGLKQVAPEIHVNIFNEKGITTNVDVDDTDMTNLLEMLGVNVQ